MLFLHVFISLKTPPTAVPFAHCKTYIHLPDADHQKTNRMNNKMRAPQVLFANFYFYDSIALHVNWMRSSDEGRVEFRVVRYRV